MSKTNTLAQNPFAVPFTAVQKTAKRNEGIKKMIPKIKSFTANLSEKPDDEVIISLRNKLKRNGVPLETILKKMTLTEKQKNFARKFLS